VAAARPASPGRITLAAPPRWDVPATAPVGISCRTGEPQPAFGEIRPHTPRPVERLADRMNVGQVFGVQFTLDQVVGVFRFGLCERCQEVASCPNGGPSMTVSDGGLTVYAWDPKRRRCIALAIQNGVTQRILSTLYPISANSILGSTSLDKNQEVGRSLLRNQPPREQSSHRHWSRRSTIPALVKTLSALWSRSSLFCA